VARFDAVVARHPELVQRRTFGNPCTYVNGNMASGLFADGWFVRLGEADSTDLLAMPGSAPFAPMPGRTMKGYVLLPPTIVADDAALDVWLGRCIAHVATLPPKR
jgi:hypothetical protein